MRTKKQNNYIANVQCHKMQIEQEYTTKNGLITEAPTAGADSHAHV